LEVVIILFNLNLSKETPENPSTEYGVSAEKPKSRPNKILFIMKQLLKPAILLLCVLFSLQSYSQVKFGLKAGPTISNIIMNYDDSDDEYATLPRLLFTMGGVADIGFNDMISLQPGLMLSFKGFGIDTEEEFDESGYARVTVAFLEIPVNVAFKFGKFQVHGGPFVAIGVWGQQKWDVGDESGSEDIKFVMKKATYDDWWDSEEFGIMKRIDYGLGLGLGFEVGPILLSADAEIGLANLTPDVEDLEGYDPKDYKNSSIAVSLTATFFLGN
jgi:hypothetical protein